MGTPALATAMAAARHLQGSGTADGGGGGGGGGGKGEGVEGIYVGLLKGLVGGVDRHSAIYLTAAVYLPLISFEEGTGRLLTASLGKAHKSSKLRVFLDGLVTDKFLPQVWVDMRSRWVGTLDWTTASLTAPAALVATQ